MSRCYFAADADLRRVPRLRHRTDEDGQVIAVCRKKRLAGDHLYFHGPGRLGVYYQADTRRACTGRLEYWTGRLPVGSVDLTASVRGDFDGLLVFHCRGPADIPDEFLRSAVVSAQTIARHAVGILTPPPPPSSSAIMTPHTTGYWNWR